MNISLFYVLENLACWKCNTPWSTCRQNQR